MKNDTFENKLRALEVPKISEEVRNSQIARARMAFDYAKNPPPIESDSLMKLIVRSVATVTTSRFAGAICSLLLVVGLWSHYSPVPLRVMRADGDRKLLSEMRGVFGASLQAVVEGKGAPSVVVSEGASSGDGFPVLVELQPGRQKFKVLSFSGQKVPLTLNGKTLEFEVYLTGEGKLILVTDNGAFSVDKEADINSFKVKGRALGGTL